MLSGGLFASLFGAAVSGGNVALALLALIAVILGIAYIEKKAAGLKKTMYQEIGHNSSKFSARLNALEVELRNYTDQEMRHQKELNKIVSSNIQDQITTGFKGMAKLIESLKNDIEKWKLQKI